MAGLRKFYRFIPIFSRQRLSLQRSLINNDMVTCRYYCQVLATPAPDGSDRQYPEKIIQLVDSISQLTLLEVADLNELLKTRLNISDTPTMLAAMPVQGGAAAAEEESDKKEEQTEFTVKLTKFDDASKVKLIKEIKGLIDGINLVQAKKFVESLPQVVKKDISKEEAEQLKKILETVGGSVSIE